MISLEVQGPCECVERFVRDFLQRRTPGEVSVDYCGPTPPWSGPFAAEIVAGDEIEVRRLLDECFALWRWSPDCLPKQHYCGVHCSESRLTRTMNDVAIERTCKVFRESVLVSMLAPEDCLQILEIVCDQIKTIPFSFEMVRRPDIGTPDDPEFETVTIDLRNVSLLLEAAAPLMSARERLEWRGRLSEVSP